MLIEVTSVSVSKKGAVWIQAKVLNEKVEIKDGEKHGIADHIVSEGDILSCADVPEDKAPPRT